MKKAPVLLLCVAALGLGACKDTAAEKAPAGEVSAVQAPQPEAKAQNVALKPEGLKVGDTAPDFSLMNVDKKLYSLKDIKDANGNAPKGYIVTFTCNTCPVAQAYESRIIELHKKMSPMGYPVVAIQPNDAGINPGDGFEAMQKRARDRGYPFVYLYDEKQEIYPQYGASRTPEIYLLDTNLKVRYHGAVDDNSQDPSAVKVNYVEKAVGALEKGQDPDPADVRAVGCSIKGRKS
ncbi:MAG: thioredoxin family protein [Lewinellaceae bacterium]|nr:thioredoxin family protein [Lewinella sp.]MCB9281570.1 thioredoxin family protein [Lewinellaceae bacterium]